MDRGGERAPEQEWTENWRYGIERAIEVQFREK